VVKLFLLPEGDISSLSVNGESILSTLKTEDNNLFTTEITVNSDCRIVATFTPAIEGDWAPEDSDETYEFLGKIRDTAKKYYEDGNIYILGNSTSAEDFKKSFELDNIVVTGLSIGIVLLVLLFTFKSVGLSVLLIIVIQGAIWINFSIPALLETPLFFLGYLIISAIQMGANIDYAIVIATRFNELKHEKSPREAIIETMNFAFPTVITSGAILAISGLLIGYMSSEATISSMGLNLGRGTIISVILVLFVLPQLLLIGDKIVEKTRFRFLKKKNATEIQNSKVRVSGRVTGNFNGNIDGVIDAVLDGDVNLTLLSGEFDEKKEGN
jgi:predicted RND superfamily exporter protein